MVGLSFFFFKQKTAYEMRISDWSSDVCSSDLRIGGGRMNRPLRILSIATLFPDAARPNFGLFVEQSLRALAAQPGIELTIVAPVGLPPFPLSLHRRYSALRDRPRTEQWNGLTVLRPRFTLIPRYGARFHPDPVSRAVLAASRGRRFDVVDAPFF